MFGLHLSASRNNLTSAAEQIVGNLEKPVVTVWLTGQEADDGIGELKFGSEDRDYCEKNSGFVPILNADYRYSFSYQFHLSAASAIVDNLEVTVKLNSTVHLNPAEDYIYCSQDFQDIVINATTAVYNITAKYYQVDCDAVKTSRITLNIGGKGNTTNHTKKLVLTGADYIEYDQDHNTCYLTTRVSPFSSTPLFLGRSFFKNHCFTYNVNEKTIAFSGKKF
uniref:Peptidase A1 domain-containing protein n=1 Tax=Ditylenchus dipsaci TaxID=166011 RepID=A0A915CPW5_9BILA